MDFVVFVLMVIDFCRVFDVIWTTRGLHDPVDFVWMFSDFCRVFDVIGFTGGVHGLCCFCVYMQ
jgi:hypothetical protein